MSVLALLALIGGWSLPPPSLSIAVKVAGSGRPMCRTYLPDGRVGPCMPRFAVQESRGINGWSFNGNITFTRGALDRLNTNEFALLAGHEIAHWQLGHRGSSIANELAADRLGAELACKAGFDPGKGTSLFKRIGSDATHPIVGERVRVVLSVPCTESAIKPAPR